jgi:diguanylate cyclase (GGDEF)-like protein
MDLSASKIRHIDSEKLPTPLYESVVRSLYNDQKTLLVGSLSMVIAPLVLYLRSLDTMHVWFAIALGVLGAVRILDGMEFRRAADRGLHPDDVRRWEIRYTALGAFYVATLGIWCAAGFARTSDEFVHLMTVTITISYIVGIMGRNFSSNKVVFTQTLCVGVPMMIGFVAFGNTYHTILGVFLLPLFFTIWLMSKHLRFMLFDAVLNAREHKKIADRFDVALNNVSHGMAMVDRDQRFVVANSRFPVLCGLAPETSVLGSHLAELADGGAATESAHGRISLRDMLIACMANGRRLQFKHTLPDGRIIETKFNPMPEDGGVIVMEDISEQVSSENEIRMLASFDPLTHLPNRRFFMNEVNRTLGGAGGLDPCTLLFVDLDNFKDINDTLGHSAGDKLLCSVALRIRAQMPENAMACRFGGDEFVIVIPGRMRSKDCAAIAEQLIAEISRPVLVDGTSLNVGASIGIAQCPANGRDYAHLLKVADVALYDAKARGRNCVSFYTEQLGEQIQDRRQIENDLRKAVDRGQLQLHFQPLVNVRRNQISTCEALLRWQHPERGMIPPGVFIPIAEEIGVISEIGEFVLREAARQCLTWPQDVSVAVNVSSLQFRQTDVVGVVRSALAASGLSPNRLEVEVTESAMLENVAETTDTLKKLSQLGVRISLDDFGTGFSSLSYLHTLPLDKVKIDRSFIQNIENDERSMILLTGVTHLARELGLGVAVEGVEKEEQVAILKERMYVTEMQGYLFGRAVPSAEIREILENDSSARPKVRLARIA